MNEACQRYAEDPEAHAAHLHECARCRAMYEALDEPVAHQAVTVDALPLAPWEGASYRAWPLVVGGAFAVLAIALGVCALAGISPLQAILTGVRGDGMRNLIAVVAQQLRPLGPVVFGVLFVVVNAILILLLRRAPRGVDA